MSFTTNVESFPLRDGQREALIALYNSTGGDKWNDNTGWKTEPLDTDGFAMPGTEKSWYGVVVVTLISPPYSQVTNIKLSNNNLSGSLPPEIGNLIGIHSLSFDNNYLTSLPEEIYNLNGLPLNSLSFNNNRLTSLPAGIGRLSNLKSLSIDDNYLTNLPAEIGNLASLESLSFNNNRLTSLPAGIGRLSNLKYIFLNNNHLTGIPQILGLTSLKNNGSDFRYNHIFTTDPLISSCLSAKQIGGDWQTSQIHSIPQSEREALIALYNSTNGDNWKNNSGWKTPPLDTDGFAMPYTESDWYGVSIISGTNSTVAKITLPDNNLSGAIPAEIGNLRNLEWLFLANNQLTALPENIGRLSKLQYLDLDYNLLKSLPEAIGGLSSLEILSVDNNLLSSLPEGIGHLHVLKFLYLDNNHLTGIPASIMMLVGLFDSGSDFRYNHIFTNDPQISAFLTKKQKDDGDWQSTQIHLISQSERAALIALYNSTGGDNWNDNSGWKTAPLATDGFAIHGSEWKWYGVSAETGTVTALSLADNNLSGTLPIYITNLSNLQYIRFGKNKLTGIPRNIDDLVNLQLLDLGDNRLIEVPESIGNLAKLQQLDLGGNQLTSLPSNILKSMSNLQSLYLDNNQFTFLQLRMGNLPGLQNLYLQNNRLTSLPDDIDRLSGLQVLDLGGNLLTEIPEDILTLSNLKALNLGDNQLTEIPEEIDNLADLQVLDLGGNQLSQIPAETGNLSELVYFYLDNNRLTSLPNDIGQLSGLQYLFVNNNQLTSLSNAMLSLTALLDNNSDFRNNYLVVNTQTIRDFLTAKQIGGDWQSTQMSMPVISQAERAALISLYNSTDGDNWKNKSGWKTLPLHSDGFAMPGTEWSWYGVSATNTTVTGLSLANNNLSGALQHVNIRELPNLQYIEFANNKLTAIPEDTGMLSSLKMLDLRGNLLEKIDRIHIDEQNTSLEMLDLGNNLLTSIPEDISHFSNLAELYLDSNRLTGLLDIHMPTGLHVLDLGENRLTAVPRGIDTLTAIQSLYLDNNLLEEMPKELERLTSLQVLDLGGNQLEEIPENILGNLTGLQQLDLGGNLLTALPEDINNLSYLKYLFINNNRLTELPPINLKLVNLVDNSSDFRDNKLVVNDPDLDAFLTAKQIGGDWNASQAPPGGQTQGTPGDLDGDSSVDVDDYYDVFEPAYSKCSGDEGFNPACDFDSDGCITLVDLYELYQYYLDYQATLTQ